MFKFDDRIKETTATTGTGTVTITGAVSGYVAFSPAISTGDYFYYMIQDQTVMSDWEIGVGQLASATTIDRLIVISSSNSNNAVSFGSGAKHISMTPISAMANQALNYYGDGSDGDVTQTTPTTLLRDMYYRNLTITSGGKITTGNFRVYVSEVLDLTAAPVDSITSTGGNGGNASGTTGGTAGVAASIQTLGNGGVGIAGANAPTNNGATGTQAGLLNNANGGNGSAGGAGGTGNGTTGGNGGAARTTSGGFSFRTYTDYFIRPTATTTFAMILSGVGGSAGGTGGGEGTALSGGAAGASGAGGGCLFIAARVINRGGSTTAGCISSNGGNGGNGATPAAGVTGRGGGGGGGSGGGGWVTVCYGHLIGSTATNAIYADSGTGGNGGNGWGTGTGGSGGSSATAGRVSIMNVSTGEFSESFGVGGNTGNANSGITGGTGASPETLHVNL